jgi:hypothetical protein
MIGGGFRARHSESLGEGLHHGDFLLATLARFTVRPHVRAFDIAQFTVNKDVQPLAG